MNKDFRECGGGNLGFYGLCALEENLIAEQRQPFYGVRKKSMLGKGVFLHGKKRDLFFLTWTLRDFSGGMNGRRNGFQDIAKGGYTKREGVKEKFEEGPRTFFKNNDIRERQFTWGNEKGLAVLGEYLPCSR